ncbi:MAG: hypothetical protein NTAFB05_26190 [Nitrobacter sp.]|uniref:hypothetical protein n=1 Tax=Nitrobacter sp. TaxID=29420 RepID=UPI00387E00DF
MTSIKDKLASSVRQAKSGAESAPAEKAETRKAPRSASATPATETAATEPAPADSMAAEPPWSVEELFPDRIWPD